VTAANTPPRTSDRRFFMTIDLLAGVVAILFPYRQPEKSARTGDSRGLVTRQIGELAIPDQVL